MSVSSYAVEVGGIDLEPNCADVPARGLHRLSCRQAACGNAPEHDAFTLLLHRLDLDAAALWANDAPLVSRGGGALVLGPDWVKPESGTTTYTDTDQVRENGEQ